MMKMVGNSELLQMQIEAIQIASYCEVIQNIMIECRNLSVIKLSTFSFIAKKQKLLEIECFSGRNTVDLVLKALSQISGRHTEFFEQLKFIFPAIDILIENEICSIHENEVVCELPKSGKSSLISRFLYDAIFESKTYTDRQFLKEVVEIV